MNKLALLLIAVAPVLYAQDVSRLLPDSIGDRTKIDSARTCAGAELYNLIDGGADIFNEYGFRRVVVQRYSDRSDNYIDVEIYEMEDSSSAYGIFSLIACNTGERIEFPGEARAGDGFLLFWKGNYYVSLTALAPSNASGLIQAASEMARRIPSSGRPHLVSMFDKIVSNEHYESKIAYIKGNLGVYNLSTISFGPDFEIDEGICFESASVKCFVFAYSNGDRCKRSYSSLIGNVKDSGDWDVVYSAQGSSLYVGRKGYLECVRLGNYVTVSTSGNRFDLERVSKETRTILNGDR